MTTARYSSQPTQTSCVAMRTLQLLLLLTSLIHRHFQPRSDRGGINSPEPCETIANIGGAPSVFFEGIRSLDGGRVVAGAHGLAGEFEGVLGGGGSAGQNDQKKGERSVGTPRCREGHEDFLVYFGPSRNRSRGGGFY